MSKSEWRMTNSKLRTTNYQLRLGAYHNRLPGEGHAVAGRELFAFARFDDVIQEDFSVADGPLGRSAAVSQAAKFQELAELDGCRRNDDGAWLA
jgi:hypothetical protein